MSPNTRLPMHIAVLGAGRIGSALAFQLARVGGHDVTVVARDGSSRLRQLRRDEGIVAVNGERADVRIVDTLDEAAPYDLVVVTLLAHQLAAVLPALARSAAQAILFMHNTFEPEASRHAVGAARCVFGMPFLQSDYDAEGRLNATFGAGGQKSLLSRQPWVDLFISAGIPAALESDMPLWLRGHAPLCIAFQSVCVAGRRRGGGCKWGEAEIVARGVRESYVLIRALGYRVHPALKARISGAPTWLLAGLLWGLSRIRSFRELLATGGEEGRALTDALVAAAAGSKARVRVALIEAMRPA